MANCKKCGKPITAGEKFCPSCGAAVGGSAAKTKKATAKKPAASAKAAAKKPAARQTTEPRAGAKDAESNKGMAIIAYIGILCLIPLLTGDYKKSPFLKFHTNQGLVLWIFAVGALIATGILTTILTSLLWRLYSSFLLIVIGLFMPLVSICILVLAILGIINAVNGRMKPLPVVGKFTIIK